MKASVNGISLHFEVYGEGSPLVLIHGIGSGLDSWSGVVPSLSKSRKVIALDVRGFGQSDKPPGPYSAELWAKDVAGLLDLQAIERATIVGHSMGGVIAQRFALDYPERTRALILESTSSQVGEKAREYWLNQADASDSPSYAAAARAVAVIHFTPELSRIQVPALIVQGLTDTQTPPGGSVIMSRNIPGSRLVMLEETGHNIHRDRPQHFVELVEGFLDELKGSTP